MAQKIAKVVLIMGLAVLAFDARVWGAAPGIVVQEFIYDSDPPTASCHASTIAQTPGGLIAAWFGGTAEGNRDVTIWTAKYREGKWQPPVRVADGIQADGSRLPCWNPVLFQYPAGPLQLFYKVGPNPRNWWGMVIQSEDEGKSWSSPRRLPDGILGPIKDKPILLSDGTLLCPSSTENSGWRVHMERTPDRGKTWSSNGPLNNASDFHLIQPTLLDYGSERLQMLCRSKEKVIVESWSSDNGRTWGAFSATPLPNPNSGIDAVRLKDGRSVLIYNHTAKGRSPINVAVSSDGKTWKASPALETQPGEYSYPAVIQTSDGMIHVTYTWKRQRIRHVVLDPSRLELSDLPAASH
jgi:predicted neuraminidase